MTEISHLIKQRAFEIGFDLVGITLAEDLAYYHNYKQWIENDFHGKMNYLSNNIEKRKNVKTLMPSAKSVISCGINYFFPSSGNDFIHSLISNYARNKDYHKIIEKMLK
ncbi:MAG: DUF1730 domain-containing protein, partial [Spirochaetota bacterium]|nr:DUF1730 domain-containing protein [Spirochaetota bacterium]